MTQIDYSAFDTPGRGRGLLDIFRYRYLLRLLIGRTSSLRYRNSVLGWFWSYVRPAVQFGIYYVVMGFILNLHRDIPVFPIYLFSGIVLVNFFNEAFGAANRSIVDNKALVRKIYLPRELFPVSAVIGGFIHFLPQLAVLLFVSLLMGWVPTVTSVGLMLAGIVIVLLFIMGIGLLFSAVNVRFRDATNIVDIIRTVATWSVPVLYTWSMVYSKTADTVPWLFHLWMSNPLAVGVEIFHHAFWAQLPETLAATPVPDNLAWPPFFGWNIAAAGVVIVLTLLFGQYVFRRFERTFAQDL